MATSGITFSGFNDIDFNTVLNAIMDQESQPLTALQTRQTELKTIDSNYATLATKLGTLQSRASALSGASTLVSYSATSSDSSAASASASTGAIAGRYEVVVNELAHAQTTVSSSSATDTDTTPIATGGTITIGARAFTLTGPTTLQGLVDQINADSDSPAAAAIVQTAPGAYKLALTSKSTGAANAFTIQNSLTATTLAFTDTDADGLSGNSDADNVVKATNASALINNIPVTSESNTLTAGIPGVTLTLQQKDPAKTVVVTVGRNDDDLADRVDAFASAYNDVVKFATDQATAAGKGTTGTLGRDALLRALRNELRNTLSSVHGSGALTSLPEIGLGFNQTGQLTFDRARFETAISTDPSAVQKLFTDRTTGVFTNIGSLVDNYTKSGGFVGAARTRLTDELSRLSTRIDDTTARLAIRRRTLQAQFIAADQAMTSLKSQQSALSSFATNINTPL